jgi:glycerol-3-phosphate dehydrogenase
MALPHQKSGVRFGMLYRSAALKKMQTTPLDVLIIGGGITGVGIALDAASRGLHVGLVEKNDFASGTSSRSTKLVHGGLRYLKNYEFRLVREVGQEREVVFRNAPHLVKPMPIMLPLMPQGQLGPIMTSLGLWLYDRLAGVRKPERRKMLSGQKTVAQEPLLDATKVLGGGLYVEYRTDDARLTLEVAKKAVEFGASVVNHVQVKDFVYGERQGKDEQVVGVQCEDQISKMRFNIKAGIVVNACGPWVDFMRNLDAPIQGKKLVLTKGVHIVVPHARLPVKQIMYFDVADGRMVFAIPREGMTYVGTTDTRFDEATDEPGVTEADITYILNAANDMFPSVELTAADVCSTWSGLRPLIFEPQKGPSELSRKDEVFLSHSGLVSIAGGKLTGYRKMAERVMDVVSQQFSSEIKKRVCAHSLTAHIALGEKPFGHVSEVDDLVLRLQEKVNKLKGPLSLAETLVRRYGRSAMRIWLEAEDQMAGTYNMHSLFLSELRFCINYEMAVTPSDFLVRRTSMLYFQRQAITPELVELLMKEMKNELGPDLLDWQDEQRQLQELIDTNIP